MLVDGLGFHVFIIYRVVWLSYHALLGALCRQLEGVGGKGGSVVVEEMNGLLIRKGRVLLHALLREEEPRGRIRGLHAIDPQVRPAVGHLVSVRVSGWAHPGVDRPAPKGAGGVEGKVAANAEAWQLVGLEGGLVTINLPTRLLKPQPLKRLGIVIEKVQDGRGGKPRGETTTKGGATELQVGTQGIWGYKNSLLYHHRAIEVAVRQEQGNRLFKRFWRGCTRG